MRTKAVPELFQRPDWSPALQEAGLKLRLLNREAWQPGGLTEAERQALQRIAAGEQVEAVQLDPRTAANMLTAAWLK